MIACIGVLAGFEPNDPEIKRRLTAFQQNLKKRGWVEGPHDRLDVRPQAGFSPLQIRHR
jgi:hypothetical protein